MLLQSTAHKRGTGMALPVICVFVHEMNWARRVCGRAGRQPVRQAGLVVITPLCFHARPISEGGV